jgi:uncharacterized protein (TIGR01777 family)
MPRVIITGGTGLIGRALATEMADAKYDVIVLSRNPDKVMGFPHGIHVQRWDGRTAREWGKLADGAEAIVNLAGENLAGEGFFPSRWTTERKQKIVQSRVDAGAAVVSAVKAAFAKPRVLIQASGIGAYGPHGDEEVSEQDAVGADFLADVTRQGEASTAPVEAMGVRRVVVRTGVVLSAQGSALVRMVLPFRLFAGGWFGSGRQWLPWIHLADEVAALRFLIENRQASGVFNLTSPQPLTGRDFGRAIGRVMRRPAFMPVPAFAMRLAFGEVASTVLDGQRALPKRLLETGFQFRFPDAESALRDLLGS